MCDIFILDHYFVRCFKKMSYLQLWQLFCSAHQNHLGKFGRGHYEEHFCIIILNAGDV